MCEAGWLDANNRSGRIKAGGLDIVVAGVNDPHIRARPVRGQSPGRPTRRQTCGSAFMHAPEPRLLDRFTADGFDLRLAGHTHGGQLCVPVTGPGDQLRHPSRPGSAACTGTRRKASLPLAGAGPGYMYPPVWVPPLGPGAVLLPPGGDLLTLVPPETIVCCVQAR